MNRSPLRYVVNGIALVCASALGVSAEKPDRPRDRASFYAEASVVLRELPRGSAGLRRKSGKSLACQYGDPGCNRCLANVENVFHEGVFGYRRKAKGGVEEGATGRLRVHMHEGEQMPPAGQTVTAGGAYSDVESIVRLPPEVKALGSSWDELAPAWALPSTSSG